QMYSDKDNDFGTSSYLLIDERSRIAINGTFVVRFLDLLYYHNTFILSLMDLI
ncbi:hypothetical protein MKX03_032452, partial [Papaver bracteatum]